MTDPEPLAYTLWATLRRPTGSRPADGAALAERLAALPAGVEVRGLYDVSGIRAEADLLVWLHGPVPEDLQAALRTIRTSRELATLEPVWNALGVHRDAEFSRDHRPAFLRGEPPKRWVAVYPFVRSHEWYLLPDDERRALLAEHGRAGSGYRGVLTNTVAAFSLGDYEWILALEADELVELVDLMRALRATGARRHVREETPFFTGRRIAIDDLEEVLA